MTDEIKKVLSCVYNKYSIDITELKPQTLDDMVNGLEKSLPLTDNKVIFNYYFIFSEKVRELLFDKQILLDFTRPIPEKFSTYIQKFDDTQIHEGKFKKHFILIYNDLPENVIMCVSPSMEISIIFIRNLEQAF